MKTIPENGSRQIRTHVNPAAILGAPLCSLKIRNKTHPTPTRAAIDLVVISLLAASVERSTLMWIGEIIQDRYLKKDNPTGITSKEPVGRRAPANRLMTSCNANTPMPQRQRLSQTLRSLRPST